MRYLALFFLISSASFAADLETEAKHVNSLLMAPCCWGSTIAEHDSDVALEMKDNVRKMLSEGKNETQILSFYEMKYGERILARPKAEGFNTLVWILPGILFLAGGWVTYLVLRKRPPAEEASDSNVKHGGDDEKYRQAIERELYSS